jgi:hypothetical protein
VLAPLRHSVEQVVAWRALVTLGKNSTAIRLQSAFGRTGGGRQFDFMGRGATAEAPTAAQRGGRGGRERETVGAGALGGGHRGRVQMWWNVQRAAATPMNRVQVLVGEAAPRRRGGGGMCSGDSDSRGGVRVY